MIHDTKKIKKGGLYAIFPWVWMLVGFFYNIWYQIYPGKYILDADLASEMVLADLLNSTGEIISTEWFYSSELRVFQSQWFYRIGLLFFPDNWHCARILAAAILLVVFIVSILLFAHWAGMGRYGVWCAAIMMWPFGRWYLVYGLYGTYYIIYMLFSLLTFAMLFGVNKPKGKKIILLYIVGICLAFASGLNGIKQTIVFFGPLMVAVMAHLFLAIRERKPYTFAEMLQTCKSEVSMIIQAGLFVICNLAGYFVNSRILSQIYSFKGFNELVWAWELPNKLYDVWIDFFLLFGHQRDIKVVDFWGIVSILGILIGFSVAFSIFRLCKRYNRLKPEQRMILLFLVSALIVGAVVFCLIGEYKQYYWLPLLPFAIAVLLIEIQTEDFSMKNARELLLLGVAICITLCSLSTVKKEMETPLFGQVGYNEVADWLVENDCRQGYAIFWNSNVLREMSDGKVETWTLQSGASEAMYEWLQEKEHSTTKPEEPYFLFINRKIGGGPENYAMVQNGGGTLVYEKDPFYIYIFDSSLGE